MSANTRVLLLLLCGIRYRECLQQLYEPRTADPGFLRFNAPPPDSKTTGWRSVATDSHLLTGRCNFKRGIFFTLHFAASYLFGFSCNLSSNMRGLNATDLRIDHPAESQVMPPFDRNCIDSYSRSQTREFGTGALRRHDLVPTRRSRVRGQEERRGWRRQKSIEMHIDLAIPLPHVT